MNLPKQCSECGEPIRGRTDKKFCSDLCRNSHHNRQNSDASNYMRSVNNVLRKNRRILLGLTEKGKRKVKVHKDRLYEKGFSFKHLTHSCSTRRGSTYYFCYEYGYLPMRNEYYFLVKMEAED